MVDIKVEAGRAHDFIIHEEDYRYTRVSANVTNDTGAVFDAQPGLLLIGNPTAGFTPAAAGQTATGILYTKVMEMAVAEVQAVTVVNQGPAVVDKTNLFDRTGAPLASVVADMAAINIKAIDGPPEVSEGSPPIN